MSPSNRTTSCLRAVGAIAISVGILTGTGCTDEEVDVVFRGISIVAGELLQDDEADEIDFGDWLASELSD